MGNAEARVGDYVTLGEKEKALYESGRADALLWVLGQQPKGSAERLQRLNTSEASR